MAERNKKIAESKATTFKPAAPINNIEMCHAQGKPAINWGNKEHTVIASHWPNGVVDRLTVATGLVTRTWPDGKEESFQRNTPEDNKPEMEGA